MTLEITFYEKPEGKERNRKFAKTSVVSETLLGALDSVRGTIDKSSEPFLARVSRIQIDVSDGVAW